MSTVGLDHGMHLGMGWGPQERFAEIIILINSNAPQEVEGL